MKIAVIGCGVIGSALARHFADENQVFLVDRTYKKSLALAQELGCLACETATEAILKADMVVLAFKPKDLAAFAENSSQAFKSHSPIVVSVLAGTPVALLKHHFPSCVIVRIMPNLPMVCGKGVIGFVETPQITAEKRTRIDEIFEGLGLLQWISESQLEMLSVVAGSAPAFNLVLVQAMIDSAVMLGFTLEEAQQYVLKTMEGTLALFRLIGNSENLIRQIASPGGTTQAGLKVLAEKEISQIIKDAYQATFNRAKELH
jgi:pyrroline-5-carboxylate reductase